jgi:hypothetical protein
MPIVRLQQQTIMPFIIRQQLHMPPANMLHMFCTMAQAIWSAQLQVIFMPPGHFSIFMVQRGTIIMLGIIGAVMPPIGPMPVPMPGMPMPDRSIIIVPIMVIPSWEKSHTDQEAAAPIGVTSPAC